MFVRFVLALLPILWLAVALSVWKRPAYQVCPLALALTVLLALFYWKSPGTEVLTGGLEGAVMALWPISLVIVAAVFTYNLTVRTGAMERIKGMLTAVTRDKRVLVLLIAWGFGGFMEGMAGFGTAVAIPAGILCGLGFVSYRGQSDMGDAPIHMSPKCSRSKNPEGVRKVRSKKYNSVSLLSGMDLRTGDLLGVLLETQECSDFTEFLKKADRHYDKKLTINIVLDDEAICQTKAILDYLSKQPKQRFKFITSPRCTFLLNLIDTLFGKMASQLLRTARFKSKQDLICHIEEWLVEINRQPLVCYWKSGRTENIERVLLSL